MFFFPSCFSVRLLKGIRNLILLRLQKQRIYLVRCTQKVRKTYLLIFQKTRMLLEVAVLSITQWIHFFEHFPFPTVPWYWESNEREKKKNTLWGQRQLRKHHFRALLFSAWCIDNWCHSTFTSVLCAQPHLVAEQPYLWTCFHRWLNKRRDQHKLEHLTKPRPAR